MTWRVSPSGELCTGAVLISFAPIFVRAMDTSPTTAAFYRCALGGALLLSLARWRAPGSITRSAAARNWSILAGLFFALDLAAWHRSIHLIGPGLATLLVNLQVFVLAGYGHFFLKQRLAPRQGAGMGMAIAGLTLLLVPGDHAAHAEDQTGVWLALATAFVYSGYILSLRRARAVGESPLAEVGVASISAAAFLLPLVLLWNEELVVANRNEGLLVLGYAVLPQVLGWVLISRGQARLSPSTVGLLLLLQPTLAFAWDVWLFSRTTTVQEWCGVSLALVGVGLGSSGVRQSSPRTHP
ncbi:MAG: DMT family transporter [Myxococcota bacterium]